MRLGAGSDDPSSCVLRGSEKSLERSVLRNERAGIPWIGDEGSVAGVDMAPFVDLDGSLDMAVDFKGDDMGEDEEMRVFVAATGIFGTVAVLSTGKQPAIFQRVAFVR